MEVIRSYPPIDDCDMAKLKNYFETNMPAPLNPKNLQEIIIFFILFYVCRQGRENIYQAIDESDKNHGENETLASNQGRIYAVPGTQNFYNPMKNR